MVDRQMPTNSSLRQFINAILIEDSDLEAFCIDFFPEIKRRFSDGMDRVRKINILLEREYGDAIVQRLYESSYDKEAATHHHLLKWDNDEDSISYPTPIQPEFPKSVEASNLPIQLLDPVITGGDEATSIKVLIKNQTASPVFMTAFLVDVVDWDRVCCEGLLSGLVNHFDYYINVPETFGIHLYRLPTAARIAASDAIEVQIGILDIDPPTFGALKFGALIDGKCIWSPIELEY